MSCLFLLLGMGMNDSHFSSRVHLVVKKVCS